MRAKISSDHRVPFWRSLSVAVFLEAASLTSFAVFVLLVTAFFLARAELTRTRFSQLQLLAANKESLVESTLFRQQREINAFVQASDELHAGRLPNLLGLTGLYHLDASGSVIALRNMTDDATEITDSILSLQTIPSQKLLPQYENGILRRYWIATPRMPDGGVVLAVFDAAPLLSLTLDTDIASQAFSTVIVYRHDDSVHAMQARDQHGIMPLYMGSFAAMQQRNDPAAAAISGLEGVTEGRDAAGVEVLMAYRAAPTLEWGIITSVDRSQALAPARRLAVAMFGGGIAVIGLSTVLLWSVSRRVTLPLKHVQRKLSSLDTKTWDYPRDISTGNEVEIVDAVAFDLTRRLRGSYDILEEKVRERTKELAAAHALDGAIFASMEHGLLVVDAQGAVTLLNPAGRALLGRGDDSVGMPHNNVLPIIDRDGKPLPAQNHPLAHVLRDHKKIIPTPDPGYSVIGAKGVAKAVQIVASPIMQGGDCIGAIAVFRDTTEDRRIEQMKSEFITIASHQLRTPIASIRWYAEMLLGENSSINEDQKSYLREISMANQRMIGIVDALLNVSNLELGTLTAKIDEPVNLLSIMKDVDETFALEISQKKLFFARDDGGMKDVTTCTDSVLFRLVYHNLLSNAVKYTPEGGTIYVTIIVAKSDKRITITVKDSGIGIPKREQHRVFQKLFRAENVKATDTDGTGLGLYICKCAADAVGAELTFTSVEGKGTTFTLVLPLAHAC